MADQSYVLVPVHLFETRMNRLEQLLCQLLDKEETMAANESAESVALNEAITGLQAELADVGSVDAEVVTDLEGIGAALGKVGPTTPEQVNAITAATTSLAALTSKLKAAGAAAATVESGAGGQVSPPPPPAAPSVSGISPAQGPAAGGGTALVSGSNLTGATSVTFDGVAATDITVAEGGLSLSCTVPAAAAAGAAQVVVTTAAGSASTTYAYEAGASPA